MALKFDLRGFEGDYALKVTTDETTFTVEASERELRRLMIDLETEFNSED